MKKLGGRARGLSWWKCRDDNIKVGLTHVAVRRHLSVWNKRFVLTVDLTTKEH